MENAMAFPIRSDEPEVAVPEAEAELAKCAGFCPFWPSSALGAEAKV
jgi:hypothetical protein